jgi:hypothetical protein
MSDTRISPLVADIISAGVAITNDTTNRLIDSLTERATEAEACVNAIRDGVEALLAGPYAPSPAAIRRALYPADDVVARYREDREVSA